VKKHITVETAPGGHTKAVIVIETDSLTAAHVALNAATIEARDMLTAYEIAEEARDRKRQETRETNTAGPARVHAASVNEHAYAPPANAMSIIDAPQA
jgi:hypothetical protein